MKEEEKALQRFVAEAEGCEVNIPQCANCEHSEGWICAALKKSKPAEYISNKKTCPHFKKD